VSHSSVAHGDDMGTMASPVRLAFEGEWDDRLEPRLTPTPRLPRELIRNHSLESRLDELVAKQPLVWIHAGVGIGKRTAVAAWLRFSEGDRISGWLRLPDTAAQNRAAFASILEAAVAASTERVSVSTPFPAAETLTHQRAWAIDLVREQKRETVLVVDLNSQWLTADEMATLTLFAMECPLLRIILIQDDTLRSAQFHNAAVADINADDLRLGSEVLRRELVRRGLEVPEPAIEKLLRQYGGSPAVVSAFVTQASGLPTWDTEDSLEWAQAKVLVDSAQLLMPDEGSTVLTLLALVPEIQEGYLATCVAGRRVDLELRELFQRGLLEHSSMAAGEYVYSLPAGVREIVRSMTLPYYLANRHRLHSTACDYFVAVGELDSAVRQLQMLGDETAALELFAAHWRTYLRLRGHRAARDLCGRFSPADALANLESSAAIWLVHSHSADGGFAGAYAARIRAAGDAEIAALSTRARLTFRAALALIALERDGIELAEAVATAASADVEEVLADLGVASRELYLEYLLTAGAVSLANGALRRGAQHFEEALALSETMSDSQSAYRALAGSALSLTANGEFSVGQDLVEHATRIGEEIGMSSSPTAAELLWCQSLIWISRADYARVAATIAALNARDGSNNVWERIARFLEAQSLFRQKQNALAAGILRKMLASILISRTLPLFRQSAVCLLGNILVVSRQPGATLELLGHEPSNANHAPCVASVRGLAHVAKGDPRAAITATDPCLQHGHQHASGSLIHVYITRAAAFEAMNLSTSAEDAFATALGMAANSGMRLDMETLAGMQLVDVHRRVRDKAPQLDSEALFTSELEAVQPQRPPLQVELTAKERDVLNYLIGPLSLAEIAAALFISKNTLKTHTRNIYGKLGVTSRAEAVDIAMTWGDPMDPTPAGPETFRP
jgi:DNA-binding CsgD family transcriptional regulator